MVLLLFRSDPVSQFGLGLLMDDELLKSFSVLFFGSFVYIAGASTHLFCLFFI